jgi:hypothetical protein
MLTIPFIAFAAGLALIALGLLGGGIEGKEIRIPQLPIVPRAACILFGCILLGSVLFDRKLFDQLQDATTTAPAPPPAPAPKHELGAAINRHLIEVHDVKRILQHVGMYSGPMNDEADDGYFQAVANFQRSRNAFEDGLVGGETFGKLRDAWPGYFGLLSAPPAPTSPSLTVLNAPSPPDEVKPAPKSNSPEIHSAEVKPAPAPKPNPPVFNSAVSLRIHYVNEQKDFAEKLSSYLSSKGYSASTIYDDFSQIKENREKSGTIRIVYKSAVKDVEPKLVQAIRDGFSARIGRLVESWNDSAASDLQIQLW